MKNPKSYHIDGKTYFGLPISPDSVVGRMLKIEEHMSKEERIAHELMDSGAIMRQAVKEVFEGMYKGLEDASDNR